MPRGAWSLRAAVFALVASSLLASGVAAAAESVTRRDFPCPGCFTVMPSTTATSDAGRPPVLVVLHGDEGSPTLALAPFRRAAEERGVILLAPRCPRALGCDRSWWQWNGDPAFLDAQVDALAAVTPIDAARVYVTGWSGGASYLGRAMARLSDRYAAVALTGGGIPPDAGCARCPRPVYYLAGDRNPLFELTDRTRAALIACGAPVQWELLPGRDHGGELTELSRPPRALAIVDFLLAHHGTCEAKTAPSAASTVEPAAADPPDAAPTSPAAPASVAAAPPPPAQAKSSCACALPARSEASFVPVSLSFLVVSLALARAHRRRRR